MDRWLWATVAETVEYSLFAVVEGGGAGGSRRALLCLRKVGR